MHSLRNATDAEHLLRQAQKRSPQIIDVAEIESTQDLWFIEFEGGGFVAEWSTQWCRLMLVAELGDLAPEGELAALNMAMSCNALWRDMGDLRLARNGEQGELLLIGELGPEDGDADLFSAALLHFESMRQWCVEAIARAIKGASQPVTSLPCDPRVRA